MGRMQSTFQRAGSARFRRAASKLGPGVRTAGGGEGMGFGFVRGPKPKGATLLHISEGGDWSRGEDWVQVG